MRWRIAAFVILVPICSMFSREVEAQVPFSPFSSVGVEASAGTLGIGPEADFRLAYLPLGVRLGANFLDFSHHLNSQDARYDGRAHLSNGGVIVDWYPFFYGFRLSAGVKINGNDATLNSSPNAAGLITVNNQAYSTAGSSVTGKISFDRYAPYLGIGVGGAILGGLTLAVDAGAMFQGRPSTALAASGPISQAPGFAANLAAEQQNLENKIRDFMVYPVVQVALGWRF